MKEDEMDNEITVENGGEVVVTKRRGRPKGGPGPWGTGRPKGPLKVRLELRLTPEQAVAVKAFVQDLRDAENKRINEARDHGLAIILGVHKNKLAGSPSRFA